jgi:hypothetical protein
MMHYGSQWFIAQAISSIRHGMGSRLAFEAARCKERWFSLLRDAGDLPLRGFAVTVRSAPCLAIEDSVGCHAQILAGQAWITAEGAPRDTIAGAGTSVPLERGVRFNVSAFRRSATVLVTAPRNLRDVDFAMHERDGMPVLSVTSSKNSLPTSISGGPAAIAAFAKRYLAVTGAAAV